MFKFNLVVVVGELCLVLEICNPCGLYYFFNMFIIFKREEKENKSPLCLGRMEFARAVTGEWAIFQKIAEGSAKSGIPTNLLGSHLKLYGV